MSQTKQSANTTHRKRLARLYAEATGTTYQQALARVIAASDAGLLPTPLDPMGMHTALGVLAEMETIPTAQTVAVPPTTTPAVTPPAQTQFVAQEGNPVSRCTGTSWRGSVGKRTSEFGPGGFNRCVKADGHTTDDLMHVDEWGNVFRLHPSFKVVRNITNSEMADVARDAGMTVGTGSQYESMAQAMKPNTLWMTADNELVKISNLYDNEGRITATVMYPVPPRTTVRSYTLPVATQWTLPSAAQVRKYERAWGFEE